MSGSPEVFGPYLVYEQLGAGGMARVHRAEQAGIEGFRKTVALKRMLPHVAANADLVRSFVREARLASFLHHSNVGQTYDLGKIGDIYFIAMELIEGRNLREVLRRLSANGSLMPVPIALSIINQICDALDYAHNLSDNEGKPLGIIHRDVSPSNVIVADDGLVKLIDFGIAKVSGAGMQTMSGTIKGKYGYMAPEYLEGKIDARADLFAVGVIAHELFTNQPLFTTRDEMETLLRVREMEIKPPSKINPAVAPEIDDIVMTALARDPDRRWQHATALRSALTTVTKRLGLGVVNAQVVSWLDTFDFDMATEPRSGKRKSRAYIDDGLATDDDQATSSGDSVMISIEGATAAGIKLPSDQRRTLMVGPRRSATIESPAGTPKDGAEPPHPLGKDYVAAVRSYGRHDALIPTGSFLSDEVVPTTVRRSEPRLAPDAPADAADMLRVSTRTLLGAASPVVPMRSSGSQAALGATPPAIDGPRGVPRAVVVLLVLLAAVVIATAVYFLLPLVT